MNTRILLATTLLFTASPLHAGGDCHIGPPPAQVNARTVIQNPAIDYVEFARLTAELQPIREKNRITEDEFIRMAAEPGTVILDARSTDRFERIHVKGALHLAFTDFTEEALRGIIPDKTTRILIYCNNNFDNEPVNLARKRAAVALNIQTFVNLHAYGYRNVRELGPLLDVKSTRIPFEGSAVAKQAPCAGKQNPLE